ncbi:helix-turn-helix domain-containing protein [Actinomadura barringtoniae]|uniref:Helix-turn-helix domain-containing protein n=1 Tax=Actinomadura barringtoniae TaxID=1427535 RepID=A0A939PA08_9ACTN|nr:helix-turn-helix domain-containing protein [Actinomadura barringtoniae]MBO2448680.1 helix-turn-helix domain-containing protein [Actinomadura barringtoniae]
MKRPVSLAQVADLPPALDLLAAARILGMGRTKAYELAKRGEFPCRVIRVGGSYVVPTVELLALLGIHVNAVPRQRKPERNASS